ncbi:ABC transporter ATP-binding protein [Aeromicrobium sp. CTD01-1L150]|uniref:ABC transporter ATP-binding protein n=1 Tax=Aeromicrobium sp. CTD01-1L150 TaxID=3341830 RepID=UPI0035C04B27
MPATAEPSGSIFRAARGRLWIISLLSFVAALCMVAPFIGIVELARVLVPAIGGGPVDETRAWTTVAVICSALVLGFGTALVSGIVSHDADNDLQLDVRTRMVEQLRRLPLGWLDARSSGSVKKLAENDVSSLHQLVAHAIQDVIMAATVPLVAIVYLFVVEWRMALVCLVPMVLTVIVYAVMMRDVSEKYVGWTASVERLNAATIEYVHGIAVVKSFGQAGHSHERYRDETGEFVGFYDTWMRETATEQTVIDVITSPVVILAYLCSTGAWLSWSADIAPIDVLPAILLGLGLTAPLLALGSSAQFLRNAHEARRTIETVLTEPTIDQPSDPVTTTGHHLALTDVGFSYDGTTDALADITLDCPPGTVTALVGASGSGKSTLARLIPRFYDVGSGAVRIGGSDVRDIAEDELYSMVGFVFQDAHLLRTSIRDNIRLTLPQASDDEVVRAARTAQIHERILRLPRGYDSVIGDDAHLSGGEGQRLTIARALLTDAPILVLDEATAFADPDSEAAIQAGLSALAADRTLVVIAHRLHTIVGADTIAVLDSGRIAERGTHDELIAADGLYHRAWERYQRARATDHTTVKGVPS